MAALREGEATASPGREENEPGAAVPAGPSYLDGMGGGLFLASAGGAGRASQERSGEGEALTREETLEQKKPQIN